MARAPTGPAGVRGLVEAQAFAVRLVRADHVGTGAVMA